MITHYRSYHIQFAADKTLFNTNYMICVSWYHSCSLYEQREFVKLKSIHSKIIVCLTAWVIPLEPLEQNEFCDQFINSFTDK